MLKLVPKIQYIQSKINDPTLILNLSQKFSANEPDYRQNIRATLKDSYSQHFNSSQLAKLSDLNVVPEASQGHFSISHSHKLGGFSYSSLKHGFDLEDTSRISLPIINRVSTPVELVEAPDPKFLWVAKEAAYKSFLGSNKNLVVGDLICTDWKSHSGTKVLGFRIHSEKTLDLIQNRGFVFSEKDILFALYFK